MPGIRTLVLLRLSIIPNTREPTPAYLTGPRLLAVPDDFWTPHELMVSDILVAIVQHIQAMH